MMKKSLDEFIKQFSNTLPPPLKEMKSDFEKELRRGLSLAFQKLNLVTREEFDIQTNVLTRTRDKLEKLEQKVSLLEHLNTSNDSDYSSE